MLRNDLAKDANGVEFRIAIAACRALFLHDLEIMILHDIRVERYTLIGQQIADDAIHIVVPFIRPDIRKRSVDVENNALDFIRTSSGILSPR